jgi:hypothetical protein
MTREMKSKVMALGNKLTPRMDGDRATAFVQAWAICKAGSLEVAVKGTSFGNRQEALRRLAAYSPGQIKAVFVPEPENKFDPAAIAVRVGVQNGCGLFTIGYIPRSATAIVSAIGARLPVLKVLSGDIYGARLAVAV